MRAIVQYWDQPTPPALIAARMDQWRAMNPDWSYIRYHRLEAADFIGQAYGDEACDAFLDIRLPAMQADVFRVAHVLHSGGLWIDAATLCLAPLQQWLNTEAGLVLLRKPHMEPPLCWNGCIYANQPQHPLLSAAWSEIARIITQRLGTGFWKLVGPGLFGRLLSDSHLAAMVTVINSEDLRQMLEPHSSSDALPPEAHWSKRQRRETLYFSVARDQHSEP